MILYNINAIVVNSMVNYFSTETSAFWPQNKRAIVKWYNEATGYFARRGGRSSHRIYKKLGIQDEIAISGPDSKEVSVGQLQDVRQKSGLPLRRARSKRMTLNVIVGKNSDGWGAYAPDLDAAIIALGDTREEAIQDFRNAMLDLFDFRREEGREVPNITALEIRETRAVETLAA